jgi:hypothetical protein
MGTNSHFVPTNNMKKIITKTNKFLFIFSFAFLAFVSVFSGKVGATTAPCSKYFSKTISAGANGNYQIYALANNSYLGSVNVTWQNQNTKISFVSTISGIMRVHYFDNISHTYRDAYSNVTKSSTLTYGGSATYAEFYDCV